MDRSKKNVFMEYHLLISTYTTGKHGTTHALIFYKRRDKSRIEGEILYICKWRVYLNV